MNVLVRLSVRSFDIVTSDLFLNQLDSKGIAKIADLGCSRFLREETMTIGIGSPLWMSPEVQKGGAYNYSADVFSYGVICYEVHLLVRCMITISRLSRSYRVLLLGVQRAAPRLRHGGSYGRHPPRLRRLCHYP